MLQEDLENVFRISKDEGAAGAIVWGAYDDFKNEERCLIFAEYLRNSLGPIAKRVLQDDEYTF